MFAMPELVVQTADALAGGFAGVQSLRKTGADCIRQALLVNFSLCYMQSSAAITISADRLCAPARPLDSV